MNEVSFPLAFLAGILSFVSPCVLPLIPGYVSFVVGISPDKKPKHLKIILLPLILFVLGFSLVFTLAGASATFLGSLITENKPLLAKIAGILIILIGLHLTGIIKLTFLVKNNQKLFQQANNRSSFVMGLSFAIGWTPCLGPILSGILIYASTAKSVTLGSALLLTYSFGIGVPLIIFGVAFSIGKYRFKWLRKHSKIINIISGVLLIIMGVLLFTDQLSLISVYLQKIIPQNWQYY